MSTNCMPKTLLIEDDTLPSSSGSSGKKSSGILMVFDQSAGYDPNPCRAELRQRLVKAGFTLPEIDTMGLFGEGEVSEEVKNQLRENAPKTRSGGETRKRARNADGTFKGDDPSTPDVNEAWEDG